MLGQVIDLYRRIRGVQNEHVSPVSAPVVPDEICLGVVDNGQWADGITCSGERAVAVG